MNKCGLCQTVFGCEDNTQILQHLTSHSINFSYFECKLCLKKYHNLSQLKTHYTKEHFDCNQTNDCFDKYIANLDQLFQEVRQQLTKSKEKVMKKFSNETENAVQGLIDEEFFRDNHQMGIY